MIYVLMNWCDIPSFFQNRFCAGCFDSLLHSLNKTHMFKQWRDLWKSILMDPNSGRSKIYSILFMSSRFAIKANYVFGTGFHDLIQSPCTWYCKLVECEGFQHFVKPFGLLYCYSSLTWNPLINPLSFGLKRKGPSFFRKVEVHPICCFCFPVGLCWTFAGLFNLRLEGVNQLEVVMVFYGGGKSQRQNGQWCILL